MLEAAGLTMLDLALLIGCTTSLVLVLCSQLYWRQHARKSELRMQQLCSELQTVNASTVGIGKRLRQLESKLAQQAADTKEADSNGAGHAILQTPNPIEPGLQDASNLLAAGLDSDEVSRRCGISKAEASLLQAMSRHKSNAAA